jgi:UDP-N-acetylmuramoyl-L-alanyl-D-glutamate--2,6-diaminopimelate ligase
MKLGRLVRGIAGASIEGSASVEVSSLAYDSRQVQPGALFVALPGARLDGLGFVDDAVRRGAVAVLHEGPPKAMRGVPSVRVGCVRAAMADVAAEWNGHPSRKLRVVGVTGTNGKTSTTHMVRDVLRAAGTRCGLVGTIGYECGGRRLPASRTTPESVDVQRMMAESLQAGDAAMAIEASSQGLAAERLRGVRFAAVAFTNLTPDHLDFHGTMENYFAAKRRLFEALCADGGRGPAIVNLDDAYGRRLASEPMLADRLVGYGFSADAAVRAMDVRADAGGSEFRVATPWGESEIRLPLPGRFNVYNALAALAACGALGTPLPAMAGALASLRPVTGRLEAIPDPRGTRHLFVDYAHTEDALSNVLQTLRETLSGRIVCVFGCGGDRDAAKRPRMGAVVSRLADLAFVTSDNPRNEDPDEIIRQIAVGMDPARPFRVEPDRSAAIRAALRELRDGDALLVAGKGHETYQEIGGRSIHFDDREAVREAVRRI